MEWLSIETAPRDSSRVLVASFSESRGWRVREAWWATPWDGCPAEQCYWCYDGKAALLDKSVHGIGASHWMPLPPPPAEG